MTFHVIYDGNCNLCVTLVQILEILDQGKQFQYIPMQDYESLATWNITPQDCELGMILLNTDSSRDGHPVQRWQGSEAAEEIGRLLPFGLIFVQAYRFLPGLKWMGDRFYEYIRDNRYTLFGQRSTTYKSLFSNCNCTDQNIKNS